MDFCISWIADGMVHWVSQGKRGCDTERLDCDWTISNLNFACEGKGSNGFTERPLFSKLRLFSSRIVNLD